MSIRNRRNLVVSLAVLALASVFLGAAPAPKQEVSQQTRFHAVLFRKGLPPTLIARVREQAAANLRDPRYAVISIGIDSGSLAVFGGKVSSPHSYPSFLIWQRFPDHGGADLRAVQFRANSEGHLEAKIPVFTSPSREEALQLELVMVPKSNTLLFRWAGPAPASVGAVPRPQRVHRNTLRGRRLPHFIVNRLGGGTVSPEAFRGRVLVIDTWATSCPPCVEEMPDLNQLVAKYSHRGVSFLALSLTPPDQVRSFLEDHPFQYQQAILNPSTIKLFGGAYPRNLIVDPRGTVVYDAFGEDSHMRKAFAAALAKAVSRAKQQGR